MNNYFKPTYTRWLHSPSTFWGNISETFRWLKWSWRRAFRGWADCDWWSMDAYLVVIILPMLKELREKNISYPGHGQASTPEKWDAILDKMIEGFEAAQRILEDEYYKEISGDNFDAWGEASKKDQELFHRSMKLFNKWFFSLWD